MNIEIYTKKDCGYCVRAKELFKSKNLSYKEYIISPGMGEAALLENQSYVTKEQLLEKYPNARTVPQIWIDGQHIGGYDNLVLWFQNK
jgi:glutaredoxin